eukprot:18768_1
MGLNNSTFLDDLHSGTWKSQKIPKQFKPFQAYHSICMVSKNDNIICCTGNQKSKDPSESGIFSYDPSTNKYALISNYPDDFRPNFHTSCIDNTNNLLYIFHFNKYGIKPLFGIFNLNTNEWNIISNCVIPETATKYRYLGVGLRSIIIDSKLNIIGGDHSNAHLIYDNTNNEFIHFNKTTNPFPQFYERFGLVKLTNGNLITFGGECHGGHINTMYIFVNREKKWKEMEHITMDNILELHLGKHGYVLVDDVIIFFVSSMKRSEKTEIWYLKTNEDEIKWKWRKSNIAAPWPSNWSVNVVGTKHKCSKIIVYGLYRKFCNSDFPKSITKLVVEMVQVYVVHVFVNNTHWRIILESLLK